MKVHELKCVPEFYEGLEDGTKTFEIRRNDRDFHTGDVLIIRKFNKLLESTEFGSELIFKVTYVTTFMQTEGFVVMGIKRLD